MLKLPGDVPYVPCDGATLYDLHLHIEDLSRPVQTNLPPDDPTRAAFDRYWEESERTQRPPSRATTLAALAAFHSLPQRRQRAILNGWRPVNIIPAKAEQLAGARDTYDVHRVLSLCARGGKVDGVQEWKLQSTSPVEVSIRAGTTMAEAIAAVAAILQTMQSRWPQFMEDVWCLGVREEEKSGTSQTPITPKLDGTKGEEAGYVTAA